MSFEFRNRIVAVGLTAALGPLALSGCSESEYDGWTGCDQATILPGISHVRPSINARIEELNGSDEQLNNGTMEFAPDTNADAMHAIFQIYEQVYGDKYVTLQAGDKVPFCVNERGIKSFDIGGEIVVKKHEYSLVSDKWQAASR